MPATEPAKLLSRRLFAHPADPMVSGLPPGEPLWSGGHDWSWAFVIYRGLPDWPGYKIGSDGSVWSCWKRGCCPAMTDHWHQLKLTVKRWGHLYLTLSRDLSHRKFMVHQLVLTTFIGPCPPGLEACHNDGNPANNRVGNLRYDTKKANAADQARHGTKRFGSSTVNAKLDEAKVGEIKRLLDAGRMRKGEIARTHGVAASTITAIVQGRTWGHVRID